MSGVIFGPPRRILDLYCGAGGCSMGYRRAFPDAEIVGVDIVRQWHYPFEFVLGDADTFPLDGFDLIHASPPCKLFTPLAALAAPSLFAPHTDHLTPTFARFAELDVAWVVENVPGAPMPADAITLCGSSFGLEVRRHRLFASNRSMTAPACNHAAQPHPVGVYGAGGAWTRTAPGGGGVKVAGADAARALGIDWTTYQPSLSQAIPPAYTEWIGQQIAVRQAA